MSRRIAAVALLLVACQGSEKTKSPPPAPTAAPAADNAAKKAATTAARRERAADPTHVPAFEADAVRLTGTPPRETSVHVSSQGRANPTAYVVLGTHCPTTAKYLERIAALEKRYGKKVDFIYLYPNRTDTPEAKREFHAEHGFAGPLIDDQGATITLQMRVGRTAEVVLAARDGTIVYRGAIDDSKDPAKVTREHAAIAIDEHLAGKPVTLPKTQGTA